MHNIGGEEFPTKESIKERCRDIIAFDVHPRDMLFLLGLISRHPDYQEKAGAGIESFFVGNAPNNKFMSKKASRCLNIKRIDGSTTDFSFYACITEPSKQTQLNGALRRCVDDQIIDYKEWSRSSGVCLCAITGEALDYSSAHVDHLNPRFIDIVKSWMKNRKLRPSDIRLVRGDNSIATIFDQEIMDSFSAYHKTHAELRMTSATANLKRKRGGK